jgi:membrane-bound lytic murein transglycosylase D
MAPLQARVQAVSAIQAPDTDFWLFVWGLASVGRLVYLAIQAVRVQRQLSGSTALKKLGKIELRLGKNSFVVGLGRRAWVVLGREDALVVAHELQHLRQHDAAWAWIKAITSVLLPWLPLIWWGRLSALEELACDAAVLQKTKANPVVYARLLVDAATAEGLVPALGRSVLYRRVEMILKPVQRSSFSGVVLSTLALPVVLAITLAQAATPVDTSRVEQVASRLNARNAGDDFTLVANPTILAELNSLLGNPKARAFLKRGLERRAQWQSLVDGALEEAGLPPELAAVPLLESGYSNWKPEGSTADVFKEESGGISLAPGVIPGRGLWMFIVPTARSYGLTVNESVDERLDPVKETEAAIALLMDLHDRYQDWGLALAGYNQGQKAVELARQAGSGKDIWGLVEAGLLNDYAPGVFAAALLIEEPSLLE